MDFDLDDQSTDRAKAAVVRAGARFKPKGRPLPKKKQVSFSTSQSKDPASLDGSSGSSAYPNKASTSETLVSESETASKTISEEGVDILSRGVNLATEPSLLRPCTNVNLEGKQCDDGIDLSPAFPEDPKTQHSANFGDSVTPATNEDIFAQTGMAQTGEEECHLDMETLDIVQDESTTNAYEQHIGKFQPKPRLVDTVIEEPESHYSVDDTGFFTMDTNESESMVNAESRKHFDTNTTFNGDLQEEELNIPEVPGETVPEMDAQNVIGGLEHEEHVVEPIPSNTVETEQSGKEKKIGKSKKPTTRKRKKPNEKEPNKTSEKPEKKKFTHSSRRQKRTLEKELLETPDDEIRFLPIRDMLRLVEYKEWLEKKEAKGGVEPPTQQSTSNMNASDNQYQSQDFGAEDEFGREDGEYQETNVVEPDLPFNYQTYMKKTARTRWSKQDTELFYEGLREFGSNLSMVQQLFPNLTHKQIKLKFKLEERRNPLKLDDALSSRSKNMIHFQHVIKKLQQEAAAARADDEAEEDGEEEGGAEAEATTDVPENEEPTKSEEVAGVKESDGEDDENMVKSDGGDEFDDDDFFASYKS